MDGQGYDPLEQIVADNVDPVLLLDCPENDLLPGSLPVLNENIMKLLRSYETCQSMDVYIQQNDTNDKESSNDQEHNPVVSHTNKSTLLIRLHNDIVSLTKSSYSQTVLINAHKIKNRASDVQTLSGLNWLNNEIINFYMQMIVARSGGDKMKFCAVYAFSTFFYP